MGPWLCGIVDGGSGRIRWEWPTTWVHTVAACDSACAHTSLRVAQICYKNSLRESNDGFCTGLLFEEPNPTRSRPRDLIGLYKQHMKPHPPNTQGRARRKHGGEQGHPEEAESHPEVAERRKKDPKREGGERGGDQGSPEEPGGREKKEGPKTGPNGAKVSQRKP